MVRKLKFHEKKLLKKVDFYNWECDNQLHESKIMQKYYIQRREDYIYYNQMSRKIRSLANKLKDMDNESIYRINATSVLLSKLYGQGLISVKTNLQICDTVNASSFCKRRLPYIIHKIRMSESLEMAVKLIEQGHIRVGPTIIRDPAYLVPRSLEDYITWAPNSKMKKKVEEFNGTRDDYE